MDIRKHVFIILTLCNNVISIVIKRRNCETSRDCSSNEVCVGNRCRRIHANDNKDIMFERYCVLSKDCPSRYYCNKSTNKCTRITKIWQVMERQSCKRKFKKFCLKTSNCACAGSKMVCEDNECVYAKKFKRNAISKSCPGHLDCASGEICESGKCRGIKSIKELRKVLMELKNMIPDSKLVSKCQLDDECKRKEFCDNGICRRRRISYNERKNVIRFKVKGKQCYFNEDCNKTNRKNRYVCHRNSCKLRDLRRY